MPVSVRLDFQPPEIADAAKLYIYESPTKEGVKTLIETVTGAQVQTLTSYTTTNATDQTYWFSIKWEDSKGAQSDYSVPWQGGTESLVGKIVTRALQRDPLLNEIVLTQEAEAIVADYFGVDDPYAVTEWTLRQLSGLTYWAMGRAYIAAVVSTSSASDSYTAGLVSQKADSGSKKDPTKLIEDLIFNANSLLGMNLSVIMLIEDIDPTGGAGAVSAIEWDQSRLQVTEIQ